MERSTESVHPDDSSEQILAAWPTGRIVADRYEVGEVLGVGGSSVIYRAFDRAMKQPVALKVLRRDRVSPAAIGRLRREVAVARNASSPHLVRVFDIGEAGTDTFLTMELVDGESLRRKLERGPLPIGETLAIAKQILRALSVLHAQKIVHRDIKPSNVLIDPAGAAKLADFGLAVDPADDSDRPTQTGTLVGTAEYMSPEQVTGAPLDARSDLYSFGVLLYECLTGQLPFGSRSSVAALLAHVRERPRSVRELRPEVPPWLSRLIDRLLAKNPDQRFGSAVGVLKLIEEERAPRNWRPALAIAAAIVLLTMTLIAALRIWPLNGPLDHLEAMTGGMGLQGVDGRGHVLWRQAALELPFSTIVNIRGSRRVAAVADRVRGTTTEARSKVVLLDPESGAVDSSFYLGVPMKESFPPFADEFWMTRFVRTDVDHDGSDEIVATLTHTYWPSYTVVYDLGERSLRALWLHSGHAPTVATADLNGDGRDELITAGVNNKMGWYNGIAALDIPPLPEADHSRMRFSESPDFARPNSDAHRLLWYQLVRPQYLPLDALRVDVAARTITVHYYRGPAEILSFDGFLRQTSSSFPPAARQAARNSVYDTLRNVERLLAAGEYRAAEHDSAAAMKLASDAGDPFLTEWSRRIHMRVLVRLDRIADAESEADKLVTGSSAPADSAWDVAKELHLTGHLDEAFSWYRRGLYAGRDADAGRMRYEFVQAAVLALAEQGRWHEAEAFLDEARRILSSFLEEPVYINYLRWRTGRTDFVPADTSDADPDLSRYWDLEEKHITGLRGSALLARIAPLEKESTYSGLLLSLKAIGLAESGRADEARVAARDALEWCEVAAMSDPPARAHLDIVRERAKQLGVK